MVHNSVPNDAVYLGVQGMFDFNTIVFNCYLFELYFRFGAWSMKVFRIKCWMCMIGPCCLDLIVLHHAQVGMQEIS